jgi:peptidoglycan/xylan/chitin deacetylase (PgdA/CDA1 family)
MIHVFNFHRISDDADGVDRGITITPLGLDLAIRTIRFAGLQILSLRDIVANPSGYVDSRHQFALITFDDGLTSYFEQAAPILKKLKCPATNFVPWLRLGTTNAWDKAHLPVNSQDQVMTQDQIIELCGNPLFTFGSHGLLHTNLCSASDETLIAELFQSHDCMNDALGSAYVPVFAYPWGYQNAEVVARMSTTPYVFAMTTKEERCWNGDTDRYLVPRHNVAFWDRFPPRFLAKLAKRRIGIFRIIP